MFPSLLLVLGLAVIPARAQPYRLLTWQVADVPMPKQTNAAAAVAVEPPRIAEIAGALSTADADAVILYGIQDSQALKRIAESIKPKKYSVAIHSVFRQSGTRGPIVGQPFGILARRDKMAAKNIEWVDTGRIDMPGGFTFATLRHGNGAVCVYVVNLPGSLTNGVGQADGAYFSRKRNYAADFLAHHSAWVATTYTNQPYATYLTGDISLVSKKPVKDDCATTLEKAGFRPIPVGVAQDKSTFAITNGPLLSRVFDPVFTRNVDFMAARQTAGPAAGDQPMVICEITLKPAGSAAVTPPPRKPSPKPAREIEQPLPPIAPVPTPAAAQLAAAPASVPAAPVASSVPAPSAATTEKPHATNAAPTVTLKEPAATSSAPIAISQEAFLSQPWLWPAIAGLALGVLAIAVLSLRSANRRQASTALSHRPTDAVFVEMRSAARPPTEALQTSGDAVLSAVTTATDNAHNGVWQAPSVQLGATPARPDTDAHAGVVPHLRQLMREKLFRWLSNQRTQLIDSHEAGTEKVLGLEERLGKLRDQFQDRLVEQEQRITRMNRELEEKERLLKESKKTNVQDGDSTKSH